MQKLRFLNETFLASHVAFVQIVEVIFAQYLFCKQSYDLGIDVVIIDVKILSLLFVNFHGPLTCVAVIGALPLQLLCKLFSHGQIIHVLSLTTKENIHIL